MATRIILYLEIRGSHYVNIICLVVSLLFFVEVRMVLSNMHNSCIDWTLTSSTTLSQCVPGSNHIYLGQDMTQGQFFKRSLTGLNSDFSFS